MSFPNPRLSGGALRNESELSAQERLEIQNRITATRDAFDNAKAERAIPLFKDPIGFFTTPWIARELGFRPVVMIRHPAAFVNSFTGLDWRFFFDNLLRQPFLVRDYVGPFLEEIFDVQVRADEPDPVREAALLWKVIYSVADRWRDDHGMAGDWHFVRHEDIASGPTAEFETLYQSLGLQFDDRIEAEIVRYTNARNPVDPDDHSAVKRNSAANALKWKSSLSDASIASIRELVEPVSSRFYSDNEWD